VDRADRFWPGVTRLVVAILIVLLILSVIAYVASATLKQSG
jgi:Tfp pilus assembly protein PilO